MSDGTPGTPQAAPVTSGGAAARQRSLTRACVYLAVGAIFGYVIYAAPAYFQPKPEVHSASSLRVGGSSVVYFIMDKWRQAYKDAKQVDVVYRPTGSVDGVTQVIDHHYQVGFTSAPLTEKQRSEAKAKGGDVIQIPVVLIGVVPVYNLPELKGKPPINFTAEVLAKIFLGKIQKWNDKELQDINEGVELPAKKIIVVRREDASGTTQTFAGYLHGASDLWRQEMGKPDNTIKWPEGTVAMPRNHGVAVFVKHTDGALGYVELINAIATKLQYGAVQNKDKSAFVLAKPETISAAAKAALAATPNDLPADLASQKGKDSYPICAVDWAVCYETQPAKDYQLVADFLHWVNNAGQEYSGKLQFSPRPEKFQKPRLDEWVNYTEQINLQYAPLPEEFRQQAEKKIKLLKSR